MLILISNTFLFQPIDYFIVGCLIPHTCELHKFPADSSLSLFFDTCCIWSCEENFPWSGILPGQNDFAWSRTIVICQNELLALCTMIKCCHDLDFLASLLLCNNLTQSCKISNQLIFSPQRTVCHAFRQS